MANVQPVRVLVWAAVAAALMFGQAGKQSSAPGKDQYGNWLPGSKGTKADDPNTRAVQGVVRLENESPAEGAVVQLKNLKTLEVRSFITKANGLYSFSGLSTSADYELHASHNGMESSARTLSTFDSRHRAILNMKLDNKLESKK